MHRPLTWLKPMAMLLAMLMAVDCAPSAPPDPVPSSGVNPAAPAPTAEAASLSASPPGDGTPGVTSLGQLLYVPAYSSIHHGSGQDFPLAITLSVRNTDLTSPITVQSVRYHNAQGGLVRALIQSPISLQPLASTEFFIAESDTTGGTSSSFLVDWRTSSTAVSVPVVEAVMVSTRSQQGLVFNTAARVLREWGIPPITPPSSP